MGGFLVGTGRFSAADASTDACMHACHAPSMMPKLMAISEKDTCCRLRWAIGGRCLRITDGWCGPLPPPPHVFFSLRADQVAAVGGRGDFGDVEGVDREPCEPFVRVG